MYRLFIIVAIMLMFVPLFYPLEQVVPLVCKQQLRKYKQLLTNKQPSEHKSVKTDQCESELVKLN